jgi:uncharacterized repeat protein (TIGR01451 family)
VIRLAAAGIALAGLAAAGAPAAGSPWLGAAPQLPVSRLPWGPAVALGDFDADGHLDAAYSLTLPSALAVLLGDGAGGFGSPVVTLLPTAIVSNAVSIATADFNADGRLDVALSDFASGASVFLGLGDGRFAATALGGDLYNGGLATGDFDGDGRADVALARNLSGLGTQVVVYRGDGAGGFGAPVVWGVPALLFPREVVAVDLDGDGRRDLAVTDDFGDAVGVLMGSPTLALAFRGPFPVGDGVAGIAAGDVNGDGHADLVTAETIGSTVSVLLGDGTGGFGPAQRSDGPIGAGSVALADVDADGRLDLAVSGWGLEVRRGDGAGHFGPPRRYGLGGDIAAAEIDGDGRVDLLVGDSLLRGDGTGGFAAQRSTPAGARPRFAVAADFDRDGHQDVAVAREGGSVALLRGDGAGGFAAPEGALYGSDPTDLVVHDLDADGWPDLAVGYAGTRDVVVLRNDRQGGFVARSFAVAGVPRLLAVGDFGGDGRVDIAVANETTSTIDVLHGVGDASFAPGGSTPSGGGLLALVVGTFNPDDRLDLACARLPSGSVTLLHGSGQETFVTGATLPLAAAARALVALDVDPDGILDLAGGGDGQAFPQVSGLGVQRGDGSGGFGPPVLQPPVQLHSMAAGDFTGDGRLDLVALDNEDLFPDGVRLLPGGAGGRFGLSAEAAIPIGGRATALFVADFDEDGRPDLGAVVGNADALTIVPGRAAAATTDLAVAIEDSPDPAQAGDPIHYRVTATNRGPRPASGVRVRFRPPLGLTATPPIPGPPTCISSQGVVTCDRATLAVGESFELTLDVATPPDASGMPFAWADVSAQSPGEGAPADNFATSQTALSPIDVALTVTDSVDPVLPGQAFRYTLSASNLGAYAATGVIVATELPFGVTLVGTPCLAPGGPTILCGIAALLPGQTVDFTVDVTASTFTSVALVATVTADQSDVRPDNDTDREETAMTLGLAGELAHGAVRRASLPAGDPAEERFVVRVPPRSSFEVVLDEASGDYAGAGGPVLLERRAANTSTVLQLGAPVGTGGARALRWQNTTTEEQRQLVRVQSRGCSTGCGADDTYRLRAYDTTGALARFNTTGGQQAVVVVQNPGAAVTAGTLWFWDAAGALQGSHPFLLPAHGTLVFNVATLLPGRSGGITLTHDAGYSGLAAKAIALEPATGLSFDTVLRYRAR